MLSNLKSVIEKKFRKSHISFHFYFKLWVFFLGIQHNLPGLISCPSGSWITVCHHESSLWDGLPTENFKYSNFHIRWIADSAPANKWRTRISDIIAPFNASFYCTFALFFSPQDCYSFWGRKKNLQVFDYLLPFCSSFSISFWHMESSHASI